MEISIEQLAHVTGGAKATQIWGQQTPGTRVYKLPNGDLRIVGPKKRTFTSPSGKTYTVTYRGSTTVHPEQPYQHQ